MAGISSLGIGSGVLTADVIDQLKEADKQTNLKPLEEKMTLNNQKQDAYTLLSSLMTTLKTSSSALSYDTIFDNKTVDVSGNADVTVDAGANVDSFTLETVTLAKKDITQFGAVGSTGTAISTTGGTLTIGGYDIAYDNTTTLSQLAQSITDTAGSTLDASILQTGSGAYSLVVSSKSTGLDQALTISDTGDLSNNLLNVASGYQKIQNADDAEFKYNGITTTRSTNEISDLVLGLNITLKEEGDFSNVDINQDNSPFVDEMQMFVDSYNSLMQNVSDMTAADEKEGVKGVFNGESFVRNIKNDLNSVITSMTGRDSLMNYGLDLDRYGKMSLNTSTLEEKLNADPDALKTFFTGGTDTNGNDVTGIFEKIDDKIKSYTGYGKMLSNFESNLKSKAESITDNYDRAQEMLNTRYEIMTKRFTAYDAMISKINAEFSSLQMMISAEVNSKS